MARRRFFVPRIHSRVATLSGEDAHHLTRVLRVEQGQKYEISDNEQAYLAEVETATRDLVSFRVLEKINAGQSGPYTTLYVALIRFERLELLIEKATELGAASIAFFAAERSERGLDRAVAKRLTRWQRVAREASEQSRRVRMPDLSGPLALSDLLSDKARSRILLDEEPGCTPILRALPSSPSADDRVSILAGPEGGWTERERTAAREAGWQPVSLGPGILRTETAVIAALAVIQAAWDGARQQPVTS